MSTILLVEDNEMNRDMLSRRLERRGYSVLMAADAEEALATVATVAPDLILMDVELPGIDGWEATRRLKRNPATMHIPVIALTAHALDSHRVRASEVGCDAYESKPVDFGSLLEKVTALTSRKSRAKRD